jgi:tetraacyldisaccharide 4'-kinase
MRETLEGLEQFAIDVILERRRGLKAAALRGVLNALSRVYRRLVQARLALYRRRVLRESNLGCMVISIGNLTVGGTGKTPVVEMFARALADRGRSVAVLSRGYKSARPPLLRRLHSQLSGRAQHAPPRVVGDGRRVLLDSRRAGDEPFMLATNLKDVPVLVDKDRVKSGKYAISNFGSDTLLLDDGLQYLRLRHRLDVVLVDRLAPFGNEYLLPRGTLREPPENLRRASYILITKCDGGSNEELVSRIRRYNRTAEIIECAHRPLYLRNVLTREKRALGYLDGKFVGCISGIAVPEGFEQAVEDLGAKIEIRRRFTDHHRYTWKEIEEFMDRCVNRDVELAVTTEKDWVRFPRLANLEVPVYVLRVQIEILSGHDVWERCIDRICGLRPAATGGVLAGGGV